MAKSSEQHLPPEELSLFCEQVGMILSSGIPLYDGMESLARSYKSDRYGDRFIELYMSLVKNGSLSDALTESGMFPPYLTAMTRIGEQTGKLDEVMPALARYYHWEADLRESIKNAVLYPTVLILMLAVVIGILVVSVLPVFGRVFGSLGLSSDAGQPTSMRIGMGLGKGMLVLVGVFLLLMIVLWLLLKTEKRTAVINWLCRTLPFLRRAREKIAAGRFAGVLSMMLVAGYPLDAAMDIAPTVITDQEYGKKIAVCNKELNTGAPFVRAMIHAKLFDEIHEKMLTFGSAAGQLDKVMDKLANIYQDQADDAIARLVALIEPTLVTILTSVIGGILLSVTLPLLSILSALG